jgi:hypothetical protein
LGRIPRAIKNEVVDYGLKLMKRAVLPGDAKSRDGDIDRNTGTEVLDASQ